MNLVTVGDLEPRAVHEDGLEILLVLVCEQGSDDLALMLRRSKSLKATLEPRRLVPNDTSAV
mgnify:FL=1